MTSMSFLDFVCVQNAIYILGIIYLFKILYSLLSDIYDGYITHFHTKIAKGINFKEHFGEWAVVTGCTQGIGLSYCKELAKRGINLVMISLLPEDLRQVSKEIEKEYKVKIKTIQADFSNAFDLYDKLYAELKNIPVAILVNNVGVAMPFASKFEEMTRKNVWDHITVNMSSVAMMTHMLLPGMKQRKKGAIINIASITSTRPFPYLTSYAASKAYVNQFSRSIKEECKDSGITVQTIIPSFVATDLVKHIPIVGEESLQFPSAEKFVNHAITTLGVSDYTTGYYIHGLHYWLGSLFSDWLFFKSNVMFIKLIKSRMNKKKF